MVLEVQIDLDTKEPGGASFGDWRLSNSVSGCYSSPCKGSKHGYLLLILFHSFHFIPFSSFSVLCCL